jgi:heat shock protein HtpX
MRNNIKTAVLLAALGGLCMLVGALLGGRQGLFIGLLIGLGLTGVAYWQSDKLAIASARARPVGPDELPEYHRIVADLSQRAGIPMPALYVSPSPQPNAFATGRSPSHAAVCINTGLVEQLSWEEITGVLAHEISHVRNRDILTSAVAAAIAQGISFAANMAIWGAMFGGGRDDREGGNPIGALLVMILGPIAAAVIQMSISRSREFEADASAARLMGTGEPLARALERLEVGTARIPVAVNPAQAQAYIAEPLRGGAGLAKMFSTHPPMADRIARLRSGDWRS